MSKLVDLSVSEFLDTLASSSPAPGGGSIAALCGAQGAALCSMVCRLTIGREKYAEYEEICNDVLAKMENVRTELITLVDTDTTAYNGIGAAFAMPKSSDEEKAARAEAIQKATIYATQVPYDTMKSCLAGLKLTQCVVGKSNHNAASDLGVAVSCFKTGIESAKLNVMINLPGIKDENIREDFTKKVDGIVKEMAQI